MPKAPSPIPCAIMCRIRCSSGAVGARFASPIAARRTVLCPTRYATLMPILWVSRAVIYVPSGHGDPPSGPPSARVTPWVTALSAPGSSASGSRCAWRSMKPGVTMRARASITRRALRRGIDAREMRTMRSPAIATSARYRGAPVPSMTVPPEIRMSYFGACALAWVANRSRAAIGLASMGVHVASLALFRQTLSSSHRAGPCTGLGATA